MTAAAVEKSATFSRDASNKSRNSQLGMVNLRYFEPLSNPFLFGLQKNINQSSFLLFYYTITIKLVRFVLILMT
jgi:hypothetical protein